MPQRLPFPRIAGPQEFARAFPVSRETLDRLQELAGLILRWQKAVNLVAPSTLGELWHRHIADSAQLAAFVPEDARRLLDLGSGGGFPGLVLAIILADRSELRVTLVESDQRKAAFLREAARGLAPAVEIECRRIEQGGTHVTLSQVDVVSARALAPLRRLLALAAPYFGPRTLGIFPKGRDVAREIDEARVAWTFVLDEHASLTDAEASILLVRAVAPATEAPPS